MINWTEEVNYILKENHINQSLDYSESIQLIIELYTKHGKSLKWIQDYFFHNRVSWYCIRGLLLREGVKLKGKGGPNREKFCCSESELKTHTMKEISCRYGVSMPTVLKRRKEHGITGRAKRVEPMEEIPGSSMDRIDEQQR